MPSTSNFGFCRKSSRHGLVENFSIKPYAIFLNKYNQGILVNVNSFNMMNCLKMFVFFVIFPEIAFLFQILQHELLLHATSPSIVWRVQRPNCLHFGSHWKWICMQATPCFLMLKKSKCNSSMCNCQECASRLYGWLKSSESQKKSSIYTHVTHLIGTFTQSFQSDFWRASKCQIPLDVSDTSIIRNKGST